MKKHREKRILIFLLCTGIGLMTGCSKGAAPKNQEAQDAAQLGEDNGVAGFLFHFDQRAETAALVRFKNQGKLPVRVTWFYERGGYVVEGQTEREIEPSFSEDINKITELYNSLNNVIVLGNDLNQSKGTPFFISFTLPDGEECRYDFVTENIIRLSEQNYSIESDGSLWKSLE